MVGFSTNMFLCELMTKENVFILWDYDDGISFLSHFILKCSNFSFFFLLLKLFVINLL